MNVHTKRSLSVFLCLFLLACSINTNAFAQENESFTTEDSRTAIEAKLNSITSKLAEATPLAEQEIISLVRAQIATYVQTEDVVDPNNIAPGETDTWIPLHDLEGNHFADLVPLVNEENVEIGFITMGAITDGFVKYMLGWNVKLLDAYRKELSRNPDAQAVFFPPLEYGLQERDGEEHRIWGFDMGDFSLDDITLAVAENASAVKQQYEIIRSSDNAAKTDFALNNAKKAVLGEKLQSDDINSYVATLAQEDYRLSCEWKDTESFVPIYEGSRTYYGGNQSWYTPRDIKEEELTGAKVDRATTGCGPVAAANILCYMGRDESKYKRLYPYTSIQKETFVDFMIITDSIISPAIWGEFSIFSFAEDIRDWGRKQGTPLSSHTMSATSSTCADFVKNALEKDKPVAAANLKIGYVDPDTGETMGWHWVTITKYFQSSYGGRWIAVSSWGERYSLDWDAYLASASSSVFRSGFVWFE